MKKFITIVQKVISANLSAFHSFLSMYYKKFDMINVMEKGILLTIIYLLSIFLGAYPEVVSSLIIVNIVYIAAMNIMCGTQSEVGKIFLTAVGNIKDINKYIKKGLHPEQFQEEGEDTEDNNDSYYGTIPLRELDDDEVEYLRMRKEEEMGVAGEYNSADTKYRFNEDGIPIPFKQNNTSSIYANSYSEDILNGRISPEDLGGFNDDDDYSESIEPRTRSFRRGSNKADNSNTQSFIGNRMDPFGNDNANNTTQNNRDRQNLFISPADDESAFDNAYSDYMKQVSRDRRIFEDEERHTPRSNHISRNASQLFGEYGGNSSREDLLNSLSGKSTFGEPNDMK